MRDLRRGRKRGKELHAEKRQKGKLKVGVDIPTPEEIKAIIDNAEGRWRPLLITAIFTGLRASELRGLRWADVDFKANELHVRQRADRFNDIGKPKSTRRRAHRPMPKFVVNTLKEWKLACPKGELELVFPNGAGKVECLANIINRGLIPAQGGKGKAKYTGMHALRHFYASWCINRTKDGGLGCRPRTCKSGSAMPASPSRSTAMGTCSRATMPANSTLRPARFSHNEEGRKTSVYGARVGFSAR